MAHMALFRLAFDRTPRASQIFLARTEFYERRAGRAQISGRRSAPGNLSEEISNGPEK
jgi:hypothetical protein